MIVVPPVIIRGNQSSRAIVQLQCRISQALGTPYLGELRANGANNYSLWFGPLNNESANHHIVARLNKGARADITQDCGGNSIKLKCANIRNSQTAITALILGWRSRITAIDSRAARLKSVS